MLYICLTIKKWFN